MGQQNSIQEIDNKEFTQKDVEYFSKDVFARLVKIIQRSRIIETTQQQVVLEGNCQIKTTLTMKDNIDATQIQMQIIHIVKYLHTAYQGNTSEYIQFFAKKYDNDVFYTTLQILDEQCPFYMVEISAPYTLFVIYEYAKELVELNLVGIPLYEKLSVQKIQQLYKEQK